MHLESFQSFYRFRYSFEKNDDSGVFWNLFESYAEITKADQLLKINIDQQIASSIDGSLSMSIEGEPSARINI